MTEAMNMEQLATRLQAAGHFDPDKPSTALVGYIQAGILLEYIEPYKDEPGEMGDWIRDARTHCLAMREKLALSSASDLISPTDEFREWLYEQGSELASDVRVIFGMLCPDSLDAVEAAIAC